jgi:hypothetical protein
MLDETAMTEALLQASIIQQQQQSQQDPSMNPGLDDMSYDDSVMHLHNTILLQRALQSTTESPTNTLALDNPNMLAFQDSSGQMWATNGLLPHLSVATDQMAELQLGHATTATSSPVVGPDEFVLRRSSTASNQDVADWQDKARTEVRYVCIPGSRPYNWQRRKVQNRAAQRAYRERKEKALYEMKELLEQKESQLQALQQDYGNLKHKYEQLLSSQRRESDASAGRARPAGMGSRTSSGSSEEVKE